MAEKKSRAQSKDVFRRRFIFRNEKEKIKIEDIQQHIDAEEKRTKSPGSKRGTTKRRYPFHLTLNDRKRRQIIRVHLQTSHHNEENQPSGPLVVVLRLVSSRARKNQQPQRQTTKRTSNSSIGFDISQTSGDTHNAYAHSTCAKKRSAVYAYWFEKAKRQQRRTNERTGRGPTTNQRQRIGYRFSERGKQFLLPPPSHPLR